MEGYSLHILLGKSFMSSVITWKSMAKSTGFKCTKFIPIGPHLCTFSERLVVQRLHAAVRSCKWRECLRGGMGRETGGG